MKISDSSKQKESYLRVVFVFFKLTGKLPTQFYISENSLKDNWVSRWKK